MNFVAYVRLLQTKSLHFSRIDRLGDPFEGSSTENSKRRQKAIQAKATEALLGLRSRIEALFDVKLPDDVSTWPSLRDLRREKYKAEGEAIEAIVNAHVRELRYLEDLYDLIGAAERKVLSNRLLPLWHLCDEAETHQDRQQFAKIDETYVQYISCWTGNEEESYAMWNLYCPDGFGVAVCTTAERLHDALHRHSGNVDWKSKLMRKHMLFFTLARVVYADHKRYNAPRNLSPSLIKRKAFAHEREIRALGWCSRPHISKEITGFLVRLDMRRLLTAVVTHPDSPDWFLQTVRDVTCRYSLSERLIAPSSLRVGSEIHKDVVYNAFHRTHRVHRGELVELKSRKSPRAKHRRSAIDVWDRRVAVDHRVQ